MQSIERQRRRIDISRAITGGSGSVATTAPGFGGGIKHSKGHHANFLRIQPWHIKSARRLWDLDDYLAERARRLRLFCGGDSESGARELSSLLAPVKIGDGGCEILISCKNIDGDSNAPYHISFGRGYRVSAALCAKLRAAAAVDNIKVECASEFA